MKQRIVTGTWAGLIFIILLIIGHIPFALFVTLIALIAFVELLAMKNIKGASIPGIVGGILIAFFILHDYIAENVINVPILDLYALAVIILLCVMIFSKNTFNFDQVTFVIFSTFYIGFAFYLLDSVRQSGIMVVLFIQILIWVTDSGAYFIGRKIGKHKLSPVISPNKTIEGFVGGVVCAIVFATLLQWIANVYGFNIGQATLGITIVVAVIISVFGQIGDLAESALKRFYGVKDSGKILPGHGGALDRFDSLIFILPILYILHLI